MLDYIQKKYLSLLHDVQNKNYFNNLFKFKAALSNKFIYKYQCITPYTTNALKDNYIWLSEPIAYNDPYDCALNLNTEKYIQDTINNTNISQTTDIPIPFIESKTYTLSEAEGQLFEDLFLKYRHNLSEGLFINNQKRHKICCFTEVGAHSLLMWSHYSQNHTGITI